MINTNDVPTVMADLNEYFIDKILKGDFNTVLASDNFGEDDGNLVDIEICGRFKFRFWLYGRKAKQPDPYCMCLSMTEEQATKMYRILDIARCESIKEKLLKQRKDIDIKLVEADKVISATD